MAEAKKTPAKKTATKKAAAKPAAAKKPAVKKPAVKKAVAKTATAAPKMDIKNFAKTLGAPSTEKMKKVTFRIQRNRKEIDGSLKTWWDEFEVDYGRSTTVLQALENIKGQQDGSLTFRRSCQASICGSCGMVINNRSRLACKTKVREMVEGIPERNVPASDVIEITPQRNQTVLKDLTVDLNEFYEKVHGINPYVQEGAEKAEQVGKDAYDQVNMVSNCIMCGLCYSDCTAMVENPAFIGPAALAKAFRFVADPREGKKTERLKELTKKDGIWDCTRCGMCIDACPKGVAPMEAIVKLRTRALQENVRNNAGARHAKSFKNDIETFGVLNEPLMLARTLHAGVLGQAANALNLVKKGKIPSPLPLGEVDGLNEVRAIFKELKENPVDVETKCEDSGPGAG
jgi:succinate dehydrogenase / fumarate reductase iron-sulfur subunit